MRSHITLTRDEKDPDVAIISLIKANRAKAGQTFRVTTSDATGRFAAWRPAEDEVKENPDTDGDKVEKLLQVLVQDLGVPRSGTPKPITQAAIAEAMGASKRELSRLIESAEAIGRLGVFGPTEGRGSTWFHDSKFSGTRYQVPPHLKGGRGTSRYRALPLPTGFGAGAMLAAWRTANARRVALAAQETWAGHRGFCKRPECIRVRDKRQPARIERSLAHELDSAPRRENEKRETGITRNATCRIDPDRTERRTGHPQRPSPRGRGARLDAAECGERRHGAIRAVAR